MNEAEWLIRKKRIDTRLTRTGWKVVRFSPQSNLSSLTRWLSKSFPPRTEEYDPQKTGSEALTEGRAVAP